MGYPSSQPAWQQQELNNLSSQGLLSGINPLVLAGVAGNESGYENAGPGINSSGYGGFYGLGKNSTYGYGGQSFTESPTILMDPGLSSFDQQSEAAAAEIASLLASNQGNLQAALAQYTGGGPTNGDYQLAMQNLGGAAWSSPKAGSGELVVTGAGGAPPGGGSYVAGGVPGTSAPNASLTAFGGALNPANWPGEVVNALKPWIARIVLVIVALILLKVGLDHLLDTDASPAGIIVDAIPSPKGATKTVRAPGTTRTTTRSSDGEETTTESESDHDEEESGEEGEDPGEGEKEGEGEEGAEGAEEGAPEAAAAA